MLNRQVSSYGLVARNSNCEFGSGKTELKKHCNERFADEMDWPGSVGIETASVVWPVDAGKQEGTLGCC